MNANKIFEIKAYLFNEQMKLVREQPEVLRGRAREILIQDFLEPFLPEHIGIDGGVIFSSNGDESGEVDIILYDKPSYNLFKPFSHFMPKKSKPFPSEVVYSVIEVENYLTEEKLEKVIKKISHIKNLPKDAFFEQKGAILNKVNLYGKEFDYFPTLSMLFAFDSTNPEILFQRFKELNSKLNISIEKQIDLVVIFNKCLFTFYDSKLNKYCFPPEHDTEMKIIINKPEENREYFISC